MKGPIQSVEVSYFVHATEDEARLRSAVAGTLSLGAEPEVEEVEGHFGNKILWVRYHLVGEEARQAFEGLVRGLRPGLRSELVADMASHLDDHSRLFLRLEKQRLVEGTLELGSADPVRIKVKPRGFLIRGDAGDFYSRLISGVKASG